MLQIITTPVASWQQDTSVAVEKNYGAIMGVGSGIDCVWPLG